MLMSTYNGEKYLEEQLESIRKQEVEGLSLLLRDDGSRDNTLELARAYGRNHPDFSFKVLSGENLGVLGSFMELVKVADASADYYAFADQDDVWHPKKILRGISLLKESGKLLYAGSYIPTDEAMKPLPHKKESRHPGFGNALVENIAIGCTIVFGAPMRNLVLQYPYLGASIHDWWFYLLGEACGGIVFDQEPYLFYRQHQSNVIGAKKGFVAKWHSRIRRFDAWSQGVFTQGKALEANFSQHMTLEKAMELKDFLHYRELGFFKRIKYIGSHKVYRQYPLDQFLLDILLLFKIIGRKG